MLSNLDEIIAYQRDNIEAARLVVISYGGTSRAVNRAVKLAREEGYQVGTFRPQTIWPFPGEQVARLAEEGKNCWWQR
ncbi:hypothetical protein N752_14280 [Desulforamulus aquiferis]|nr:hypothetical protein N752_14280 [Desulforamulus aquiferis]